MRDNDNDTFRYHPDRRVYAGHSGQDAFVGRGDQATFIGRNSERGRFNDQSTYYSDMSTIETRRSTFGTGDTYTPNNRNNHDVIDERYPYGQQAQAIGRTSGSNKSKKSKKSQKKKKTTTITANTPLSSVSGSPSGSKKQISVVPMTKKEYYNLPSDRTAVTVHTKPPPAPKTKIITVRKEISSYNNEDELVNDCAQFWRNLQHGPLNYRFLTCVGAIFMVVATVIDFEEQSYYGDVSIFYTIVALYVWVFAIFIISLEVRPFHHSLPEIHRDVIKTIKVLRFSWGRGFLYIFSGGMQLCLITTFNMIAGGVMMLIGIYCIIIGKSSETKLNKFVRKLGSTENVDMKFSIHDRDRDGYLNTEEFGHMIAAFDIRLSYNEFLSAFTVIDRNSDRYIIREDLYSWLSKYRAQEKNQSSFKLSLI
mmetsp:Transcript_10756/g.13597  ORF Transcript_10756/g.13597 Transcript_10756/m.13597 type:complete len:422 (+) Transcript_10756:66-1331(+)